jgi:hypothetical protein
MQLEKAYFYECLESKEPPYPSIPPLSRGTSRKQFHFECFDVFHPVKNSTSDSGDAASASGKIAVDISMSKFVRRGIEDI